ncbi:hypothetical protein V496_01830 [Pseudogymnoascus sp. VKM F-4515 (FW-2607)]|nr:hypothetical protein V496_01830 [Pseudogymnoascus sp. VKM F-4515 (FW-2607)]
MDDLHGTEIRGKESYGPRPTLLMQLRTMSRPSSVSALWSYIVILLHLAKLPWLSTPEVPPLPAQAFQPWQANRVQTA